MFDSMSEDLGGFQEQIAPGAFKSNLKTDPDVRALVDHDPTRILGRTHANPPTLELHEDKRGLRVNISPPDTTVANDLVKSMRRGDINQMSFGFRVVEDDWDFSRLIPLRTLLEVELFDVSVVTFPAYASTEAHVENRARRETLKRALLRSWDNRKKRTMEFRR